MSVEKPERFVADVQDVRSGMDWLSLIVGSADVVLRRWSVLFDDSVLGRYMDINVFKITSFSCSIISRELKTFPSL